MYQNEKRKAAKLCHTKHVLYLRTYLFLTNMYIYKYKYICNYTHTVTCALCHRVGDTQTTIHQLAVNMKTRVAEARNRWLNITQTFFEVSGIQKECTNVQYSPQPGIYQRGSFFLNLLFRFQPQTADRNPSFPLITTDGPLTTAQKCCIAHRD